MLVEEEEEEKEEEEEEKEEEEKEGKKKEEEKKAWGEQTTTKKELARRNAEIYADSLTGKPIKELAETYFLAEKSIQRIIRQERSKRLKRREEAKKQYCNPAEKRL